MPNPKYDLDVDIASEWVIREAAVRINYVCLRKTTATRVRPAANGKVDPRLLGLPVGGWQIQGLYKRINITIFEKSIDPTDSPGVEINSLRVMESCWYRRAMGISSETCSDTITLGATDEERDDDMHDENGPDSGGSGNGNAGESGAGASGGSDPGASGPGRTSNNPTAGGSEPGGGLWSPRSEWPLSCIVGKQPSFCAEGFQCVPKIFQSPNLQFFFGVISSAATTFLDKLVMGDTSTTSTPTLRSLQLDDTISDASTICGSQHSRSSAQIDEDDEDLWVCSYNTPYGRARNWEAGGSAHRGSQSTLSDVIPSLDLKTYQFGQAIKPIRLADTAHFCKMDEGKMLTKGTVHSRRLIQRCLRSMRKEVDAYVSCVPIGDDLFDLLGSIEGPLDTPYAGGVFYIRISIPKDYPFKPPTCQFLTKVFHPNINPQGSICLTLFGGDWSPAMARLDLVLISICALLSTPNANDALVPEIADQYLHDRSTYNANARLYTARYATGARPSLSPPSSPPPTPILPPPASTRRQSSSSKTRDDLRNLFERLHDSASNSAHALSATYAVAFSAEDVAYQEKLTSALQSFASEVALLRKAMRGWGPRGELEKLRALAGECVEVLRSLDPVVERETEKDGWTRAVLPSSSTGFVVAGKKYTEDLVGLVQVIKETRVELYGDCAEVLISGGGGSGSVASAGRVVAIREVRDWGEGGLGWLEGCAVGLARERLDSQRWDPRLSSKGRRVGLELRARYKGFR
ncbi:MAG: E2 SUMO-conjugating protein ubc9 [Candelina mexicana]|nr:MAG: E2 SUMO-conjugating protein ubc9 [Candelina mexicana]